MDRTDTTELGITWKQECNTGPRSQCWSMFSCHSQQRDGLSDLCLTLSVCQANLMEILLCTFIILSFCQKISSSTLMSVWAAWMYVEVCDKKQVLWSIWSRMGFENLNCSKCTFSASSDQNRFSGTREPEHTFFLVKTWHLCYPQCNSIMDSFAGVSGGLY